MRLTYALLFTLALSSAAAQSFDCKLAQSPREKIICSSEHLSGLAASYKSLLAQLSPASAALVQSDQREWLHWIDLACPAATRRSAGDLVFCLENQYSTRIHDLEQTAHLGSAVIFPRARFLFKPGPATSINNPGFGYGILCWPQIDIPPGKPNTEQTAFNAAIQAHAAEFTSGYSQVKNASFDTGVNSTGTVEGHYTIDGVNHRLIDITLIASTCDWGAAHPLNSRDSFVWWFDRSRPLVVSDVFRLNSDWQQTLNTLAIASLRRQPDVKDMLNEDALNQWLDAKGHQGDPRPGGWTVTSDGLTITFGQYAIGPYALGMPQAQISWNDLKPDLNPTLNPATLPTPLPKSVR